MKQQSKILGIVVAFFIIGSLTACSQKNVVLSDQSDDMVADLKEQFRREQTHVEGWLNANVMIDADVTYAEQTMYEVGKANWSDISKEKYAMVLEEFFPNKDNRNDIEIEIGDGISGNDGEYGCVFDLVSGFGVYTCYDTPYYNLFRCGKLHEYPHSLEEFGVKAAERLKGMKEEAAIEKVKQWAELLEIDIISEPYLCLPFTNEELKKIASMPDNLCNLGDSGYSWKEEDSCYYIMFQTQWNNVPESMGDLKYTHFAETSVGELAKSGYLVAVVREDGRIALFQSGYRYRKIAGGELLKTVVKPEDVPMILQEELANVLLDQKYIIEDISFCYIPQILSKTPYEFKMIPVYEIIVYNTDDRYRNPRLIRIDVTTGETV